MVVIFFSYYDVFLLLFGLGLVKNGKKKKKKVYYKGMFGYLIFRKVG